MKKAPLLAAVVFVAACGSAPKPEPKVATTQTTAAEPAPEKETKSALEAWAEAKVKKEEESAPKAKAEAQDPLAMSDDGDTAMIPKVEKTPAKELRRKGRGDLQAGFGIVRAATTYEEATKKLEKRLGKPTWTENGTKRIWIAREGVKCHRLVLAADGSVEVESAAMNEERQLTATARQNACTGEIKRGVGK